MSNANSTAFPSPVGATQGLTKRELFAAMAMQGLIADHTYEAGTAKGYAEVAIYIADALIAELEKQQ